MCVSRACEFITANERLVVSCTPLRMSRVMNYRSLPHSLPSWECLINQSLDTLAAISLEPAARPRLETRIHAHVHTV